MYVKEIDFYFLYPLVFLKWKKEKGYDLSLLVFFKIIVDLQYYIILYILCIFQVYNIVIQYFYRLYSI